MQKHGGCVATETYQANIQLQGDYAGIKKAQMTDKESTGSRTADSSILHRQRS